MQGDKWRRSGSDFGNQHAGRQMKGDKWRRETRSGSDFGNQQPNLWEVRTPIASSYLGKKMVCSPKLLKLFSLKKTKKKLHLQPQKIKKNTHQALHLSQAGGLAGSGSLGQCSEPLRPGGSCQPRSLGERPALQHAADGDLAGCWTHGGFGWLLFFGYALGLRNWLLFGFIFLFGDWHLFVLLCLLGIGILCSFLFLWGEERWLVDFLWEVVVALFLVMAS